MELNKDGIELTEEDLTKVSGGAMPNAGTWYYFCNVCTTSFGYYWEDSVQGGHANFACHYHEWKEHNSSDNPCEEKAGWGYSEAEQKQIVEEYGQVWYK